MLQPKTPTTPRTTASTTPKNTSLLVKRSCGLRRLSFPFVSHVMKRSNEEASQEIFSTPKRSKHDKQNCEKVKSSTVCGSLLGISSSTKNCTQSLSNQSAHSAELLTKTKGLIKTIQEKEDSLRKLKLVKMYRKKNDLTQLQALIDKWRTVSQEAAERLLSKIQLDPQPTMGQLLSNLQVDKGLIHYSEEDEGFY